MFGCFAGITSLFDSSPAFPHGLCFWLPVPVRVPVGPGCRRGLSVLAHAVSRRALGSRTTPDLRRTRAIVLLSLAFPLGAHGRHPDCVFRSSIPGPSMPLSTLHPATHVTQRKTRGQDGSLLLSCGALSSPTARRFIPTIALPYGHGSQASVFACNELQIPVSDQTNAGAYLFNCCTKKSAIMWLASIASGSVESYQKACGRASKTTSRASTPAFR